MGSPIGIFVPDVVRHLKSIGDIFLNILFVTVIPLVCFAIAIVSIVQKDQINKILYAMGGTFLLFIVTSSAFTFFAECHFPTEAFDVNFDRNFSRNNARSDRLGQTHLGFYTLFHAATY